MAKKKTYGTARAFTEGHLEVLGDQSEVSNPSPPAEDPGITPLMTLSARAG